MPCVGWSYLDNCVGCLYNMENKSQQLFTKLFILPGQHFHKLLTLHQMTLFIPILP